MARALTAPELARQFSRYRATTLRVEIQDSDGAWVDYTNLNGRNWVIGAGTTENPDTGVVVGSVTLARMRDGQSISPLIESSLLNRDALNNYAPKVDIVRRARFTESVDDPGSAPGNYHRVFEGYTTSVDFAQPNIVVTLEDLGYKLSRSVIHYQETRGVDLGELVEVEMQALIDRWVLSPPTIVLPGGSPGWAIKRWDQARVSVLEAVRNLAIQIGYEIRYEWGAGDAYELQFYEPDRAKTVPDWTIGPTSAIEVSRLNIDEMDIRTVGEIEFFDASLGIRRTISYTDPAGFNRYGDRFIGLSETGNIDSDVEATAMIVAAVTDLSSPFADHEMVLPNVHAVERGDLIRHLADGVRYDVDQDFFVNAIRREWAEGRATMYLQTGGKPKGAYRRWFEREGDFGEGGVAAGVPVFTVVTRVGEGSADGGAPYGAVHYRYRWGPGVDEVRVFSVRGPDPNQTMPSQDTLKQSTVLTRPVGKTPNADNWEMYHTIITETGNYRKDDSYAQNADTGLRSLSSTGEIQAIDSGTGPTGPPSALVVTPNGRTNEVRWTNADPLAEALVYRNEVNVYIEPPGGPGSFDDEELDTSIDYVYEVIHLRNGQTSAGVSTAPAVLYNPDIAWAAGFPGPKITQPYGVLLKWVGNAGVLAGVDVLVAPANLPQTWRMIFSWQTLLSFQEVNPAAAIFDATYPRGTDVWLMLQGNPITPGAPKLFSIPVHVRYGEAPFI